jgi:hypothetical protein
LRIALINRTVPTRKYAPQKLAWLKDGTSLGRSLDRVLEARAAV